MNSDYDSELSFIKLIPERIQQITEEDFDSEDELIGFAVEEIFNLDEFNPVRYEALLIIIEKIVREEEDERLTKEKFFDRLKKQIS